MLKRIFLSGILLLPCLAYSQESVIFKAMQDELNRSVKSLKMKKMSSPYYLAYMVEDNEQMIINASFGAITGSDYYKSRILNTDLRVGNYELDNSNFISSRYLFSSTIESSRLPIEDDYDAIRYEIWLTTDKAYKNALETLSKKQAVLKNRIVKEKIADFTRAKATTYEEPVMKFTADKKELEELLAELSLLFRKFKNIQASELSLVTGITRQYFIDSDKSKSLYNLPLTYLKVSASTQSADGDEIEDEITFCASAVNDLPDKETMVKRIKEFAENLSKRQSLVKADKYIGPVLFTDEACCQIFYEIIGKGLSNPKPPLYENEEEEKLIPREEGFLVDKPGYSILPASFSVYDDPKAKKWENPSGGSTYLIGSFSVDEQGVIPQKIELVKSGKITDFPMSRAPTKERKETNGHARSSYVESPVGRATNLFVSVSGEKVKPEEAFIKLLKENGLEYGILINRLASSGTQSRNSMMRFFRGRGEQEKRLLSQPVSTYKLYTDGRIEVIRGLDFEGVTYKVLQDIIAAGEDNTAYNFISQNQFGGGIPVSVVAMPVIIEDMELIPEQTTSKKLPIVPHPYFKK